MKNSLFIFLFALISFSSLFANKPDYEKGEILAQTFYNTSIEEVIKDLRVINGVKTNLEIKSLVSPPTHIWLLSFDDNLVSDIKMLEAVKAHRNIQTAQFNHKITYRAVPNDPQYNSQWQYNNPNPNAGDLSAEAAWEITTGGLTPLGDTIVVCIVDDGIDETHPDMIENLWKNHAEIPNNGIDDDGNGYVDDYKGWSTYSNNDNIGGGNFGGGHGTPVAGIVGAKGNNEIGVAGVNWDVKLMIVPGGGNESGAIAAYTYPLVMRKRYNASQGKEGAFVVATNSSWGINFGQPEDSPLWCAFYDTLGVHGILSAGATINGNENVDIVGDLPTACSSEYLITVTNLDQTDNKVSGAGYGVETIDLGAFGQGTFTAASGGGYGGFGGTSGATPHVAGAIALMYSADCEGLSQLAMEDPAVAAEMVRDAILEGVDPNNSLEGITVTGGRLNLHESLNNILKNECVISPPQAQFTASATTICPGASVTFTDLSIYSPEGWLWLVDGATPSNSPQQNPTFTFNEVGTYTVELTAFNENGVNTLTFDDYIVVEEPTGIAAPIDTDFEGGNNDWRVVNVDEDAITWELTDTECGGTSYKMDNYSSANEAGASDYLEIDIDLSNFDDATLFFDHAYAQRSAISSDTLVVLVENCPNENILMTAFGDDLSTVDFMQSSFSPESCDDWKSNELDLSEYAGSVVTVSFLNMNGGGNNLYIDNVMIDGTITGLNDDFTTSFDIYPNPNQGNFTLHFGDNFTEKNIEIINLEGKTIFTQNTTQNQLNISENLVSGVYFVKISGESGVVTEKVVVE